MTAPSAFIGSSSEGLRIAQHIKALLINDAEVTIWHEGVFGLNQGTFEGLLDALESFDFAILVLTPDDLIESRKRSSQSPRDNVLFECGLF
jgi:predicted nucleotide-binding protein